MNAPTPNAELAYRVLDLALKHEPQFSMGTWGGDGRGAPIGLDDLVNAEPDCGTAACLAGWTVAMAGYKVDSNAHVFDAAGDCLGVGVDALAQKMLGITDDEREELFFSSGIAVVDRVAEIFGPRPGAAS